MLGVFFGLLPAAVAGIYLLSNIADRLDRIAKALEDRKP